MGLLDFFRTKKKEEPQIEISAPPKKVELPYDVKYEPTYDGRLQVDFKENNPNFAQGYDITRLIIDGRPLNLAGKPVHECLVSWYDETDTIRIDPNTRKEISRRTAYQKVLAEIDVNLLQIDPNYCNAVMKDLLNRRRVTEYLNAGLKDNPEKICGNYVGGIEKTERGYGKYFDGEVGKAAHYSEYMQKIRRELKEQREANRQREINERKEKIARLQSEIDSLGR